MDQLLVDQMGTINYCLFKKCVMLIQNALSLSVCLSLTLSPSLGLAHTVSVGLTFQHKASCNVFSIGGRYEAHYMTPMLPFEIIRQPEENINKCLPPSTFKSPPPSPSRKPQPHMRHIT